MKNCSLKFIEKAEGEMQSYDKNILYLKNSFAQSQRFESNKLKNLIEIGKT